MSDTGYSSVWELSASSRSSPLMSSLIVAARTAIVAKRRGDVVLASADLPVQSRCGIRETTTVFPRNSRKCCEDLKI
jgi:hypothetical protein